MGAAWAWLTGLFGGKLGLALAGGLALSLLGGALLGSLLLDAREANGRLEAHLDQAIDAAEANRAAHLAAQETAQRQGLRSLEDQRILEERTRDLTEALNAISRDEDGPASPVLRNAVDRLRALRERAGAGDED